MQALAVLCGLLAAAGPALVYPATPAQVRGALSVKPVAKPSQAERGPGEAGKQRTRSTSRLASRSASRRAARGARSGGLLVRVPAAGPRSPTSPVAARNHAEVACRRPLGLGGKAAARRLTDLVAAFLTSRRQAD